MKAEPAGSAFLLILVVCAVWLALSVGWSDAFHEHGGKCADARWWGVGCDSIRLGGSPRIAEWWTWSGPEGSSHSHELRVPGSGSPLSFPRTASGLSPALLWCF